MGVVEMGQQYLSIKRKRIELGGQQFLYRDTETPGTVMLCLHGRFGRGETWVELMARYADSYRVIAPDQRGHGMSSQPVGKYTAEEMADDAAALLTAIDAGPAVIVGHSMGARVAGYLTARHAHLVSALVLLDQTAAGPPESSTLPLTQLPPKDSFTADWPLPFSSYQHACDFLLDKTQCTVRTDYYLDSLVERDDGYHMLFSQQATSAIFEYQQDWFHLLPTIIQPVFLVRAKNSVELPLADCERMINQLPAGQMLEVSRPEHHVYLSDPDEFFAAFDRFLQTLR